MPTLGTRIRLPKVVLLSGQTFDPMQTAGQVTLVYWWASTCPFCALQSPEMQKLWDANRSRGLQMLSLSIDRKPQDAQAYLVKKGYTFPAAWVSAQVYQQLPKPKGLPITWVLGREGQLLQAEKGQMFAEDVALLANWLG
jgi:peroxiredoxin